MNWCVVKVNVYSQIADLNLTLCEEKSPIPIMAIQRVVGG